MASVTNRSGNGIPVRRFPRDGTAAPAAAPAGQGLVTLGAAAIVVAGLYVAHDLLVPLVLAVLLAFVLAPVARALQRLRIGRVAAVLVAVAFAATLVLGTLAAVSGQLVGLAENLPRYQEAVQTKLDSLRLGDLLRSLPDLEAAVDLGGRPTGAEPLPPAAPSAASAAAPRAPLEILRGVAEPLLGPLATAGLVLVFLIFVLLYREDLRDRLIRLAGTHDLHRTIAAMDDAAWRLSRFFLAQVALNAGFGGFVTLGLWAIGLPSPLLWGILAGLMRFVPFVGTFIAVVPPTLLALAVDPGWGLAIAVLALFLVSEPLMGQVFEPLLYGASTGLSPLSVILAATFWAFLWGPIGLLLATPLTVLLVVLGRHVERLSFLEIMLGDSPTLNPEEMFYQRALLGDEDGLVEQARRRLREEAEEGGSVAAWCDHVALPGLALAQVDWSREVMEPQRAETVARMVEILVDEVAEAAAKVGGEVPAAEAEAPLVLCLPARGPFDAPSAALAALALRVQGGMRAEVVADAAAAEAGAAEGAGPRICLLSAMAGGSSAASLRYTARRLRRRLPAGTRLAIALWQAAPDSPTLAALRADTIADGVVSTVEEALALGREATQRVAAQP